MKKIIASVVAMLATVSMVACGDIENVEYHENDTTIVTTTTTTTSITTIDTISNTTMLTTTEVSTQTTEITVIETEPQVYETETPTAEIVVETQSDNPQPETILIESEPVPIESVEEYLVYKPSTHYIHNSTCRWNNGDAYRVDCTTELVARLCDECNPDVGDYIEYVEPEPEVISTSDSNRYYLAIMVKHECSPRASVEHNATAVACMFNRVRDGWASSIYEAIQVGCVPWWGGGSLSDYGLYGDTGYCYDAVDYYLSHSDSYTWQHSWDASGDGIYNNYY